MAYLDPNILRIPQQPTPVEQMGQAYQLGEFVEKRREREQQQKDSAWLQEQLRGGANLYTSEGLADLLKKAPGNVSISTMQKLHEQFSASQKQDIDLKNAITQGKVANIDLITKQGDAFATIAMPIMAQVEKDTAQFGQQKALENFNQIWPTAVQQAAQTGIFSPEQIKAASGWDFYQAKNNLEASQHFRKIRNEALTEDKTRQEIAESKARQAQEAEMFPLKKKETQAAIAKHYADINKAQQEAAAGGKPPAGYRWTKEGNLEAIPGGPAFAKSEAARTRELKQLDDTTASMDRLATAANSLLTHPGLKGITGLRGAVPDVPGFAAADAEAKRETLQSQIGFSVLQNMRDASKTGGALGQVTEKELSFLQNNLASLKRSQSPEQMQESLKNIIKWTEDAKDRMRKNVDEQIIERNAPKDTEAKSIATPKGIPSGAKLIGHTPDGKKVWKTPDGKQWAE